MKEWELTDEEIEELLGLDFRTAYSGHVEEYRDITKAAQKKLVRWLKKHEHNEGLKSIFYFCIPKDDWQSLIKSLED